MYSFRQCKGNLVYLQVSITTHFNKIITKNSARTKYKGKNFKFNKCRCLKYVDPKKVNNMAKVNYFDHDHKPQYQRYFNEEFKKGKVRELEKNISSVSDICKTYSVSRTSVYNWIYKYSVMAKKQVKQVVEAKSDTQKIKALEERIKELERIIGQKQLLLEFKDKMIEIAEATYNVDIKKKVGSRLSSGTTTTAKNTGKG